MPLPRPIGDPFVVKDEPSSNSGSSKRPISASAFSFSLGSKSKETPKRKLEPISGASMAQDVIVKNELTTPVRSKMTPMKTRLDSLPSLSNSRKRVNDSPFALRHTPQDRIRLNDSPFAQPSSHKKVKDEKPMISLGNIGKVELEGIHVEAVRKRVEEEGLGVSPRGKKMIKYHGKGPIPLSFILSNALNTQHSSLVLFYASLQNTLYPTRTPKKVSEQKAPMINQVIKTAPVILHPVEVIRGRTGWSIMCCCEVIKGDLEGRVMVILQPIPSECAKLGLDPRMITLKPPPDKMYEIGLWGPWTTNEIEGYQCVFASRYIIAEQK